MSRSRSWCFTLNNFTEHEVIQFKALPCKYIVFGEEVGEEGTPHLQGYVHFGSQRTLTALKKKPAFSRAHLEVAKADAEVNKDYCTKDATNVYERGEPPLTKKQVGDNEKDRWASIKSLAKQGKLDAIDPKVYIQNYKTLKSIMQDNMPRPKSLDDVCGEWIWGLAGTGKTHSARTLYPDAFIKQRNKWWDGYAGQEVVIMDDIDPYNVALGPYLKDWGDKWSFMAEHKGTSQWIRPKKFIVTSQFPPEAIWKDQETLDAIYRRFHVHKYTGTQRAKRPRAESAFQDQPGFKKHKRQTFELITQDIDVPRPHEGLQLPRQQPSSPGSSVRSSGPLPSGSSQTPQDPPQGLRLDQEAQVPQDPQSGLRIDVPPSGSTSSSQEPSQDPDQED